VAEGALGSVCFFVGPMSYGSSRPSDVSFRTFLSYMGFRYVNSGMCWVVWDIFLLLQLMFGLLTLLFVLVDDART